MSQDIVVVKQDYIAEVTLNRPKVKNALSMNMREQIGIIFEGFKQDDDVRVAIITGSGDAFCAGGGIQEISNIKSSYEMRDFVHNNPLKAIRAITTLEKPVIAMVRGAAVGAGCSLALACDLIIASDNARFGLVFSRIGLGPDWGSSYFVPRLIGPAKAKELFFTGKLIDAHEAERIGLINQVVPDAQLESTVHTLAQQLADGPTKAIGMAKLLVSQGMEKDLLSVMDYESFAAGLLSQTEDHKEGLAAFMEKRSPKYKGK